MMRSSRSKWISGIGAVVLAGGLVLADYGPGVTLAKAAPAVKEDPHAGVTPNWDKVLPVETRFTVLADFGGAAVRDNETGLVWEKEPALTTATWGYALSGCANKAVGGRKGWRIPSVAELSSLVDPNSTAAVRLPANHPFTGVQSAVYWSASSNADDSPPRGACSSAMAS